MLRNDFVPRLEARHESTRCLGVWELNFSFFRGKAVCVEPAEENLSTDAGLLVVRQFEEQHRFASDFVERLDDLRRDPTHSQDTEQEMS